MNEEIPGDDGTTIARPRVRTTKMPSAPFVLLVVDGPDQGKRFEIDGANPTPVLIGSGPACDVRLTDRSVSRRHAAVDPRGESLALRDLSSRNGTRVNGVEVQAATLHGEETLYLGETILSVTRGKRARPPDIPPEMNFGDVVGGSLEMRRLYPLCARLAQSNIPVVIEGETGVGKEVLAEALHRRGCRAEQPFVVFDCTATPPNLMESTLFGHKRGAFTGAVGGLKGLFELAHRGTLFVDEIGDLELNLQAKLLRAIERSEFRPVGSEQMVRVDVRILAATRRDLDREVQAGRFRDDLFHRLAVARVELPPLRDRQGDIPVLVQHFCEQMGEDPAKIPPATISRWEDAPWPGNVRELRNAVARYLALGDLEGLQSAGSGAEGTADVMARVLAAGLPLSEAREHVVLEFERRYVAHTLSLTGGNVTRAAEAAGVGRRYFQALKAKIFTDRE